VTTVVEKREIRVPVRFYWDTDGKFDGIEFGAFKTKLQEWEEDMTRGQGRKEDWVSVHDRLPMGQWNINHSWLSEEVLIANSCSINIGFYNRRDGTWYVGEPIKKEWIDKITHWMPLPFNPHMMVE